jgi:hypothetical protein
VWEREDRMESKGRRKKGSHQICWALNGRIMISIPQSMKEHVLYETKED